MEIVVTGESLLRAASLLTAAGVLGGAALWCVRFVERQRRQDKELEAIREENSLICFGVLACLKGLKDQGCEGAVVTALEKLEKHLNQAAHEGVKA